MQPRRARFLGVLAAAWAVYAAGTHARVFSAGNDASRWAQVESLIDYGSASIEPSRFHGTVDRVAIGGREYSNKPPLLALAGAALYAPLEAATGWRLGDPVTGGRVIWLLTVLLVGLPGALTVALFDRGLGRGAGEREEPAPPWRTLLTVALAAGTLLLTFGVTFDSHVPAACLLLVAALAARGGRPLASGLATGAAGALDLLPGFGMAPFLAWALAAPAAGRRGRLLRFALGVAAGLVLLAASDFAITGWPLPTKLVPGAVDVAAAAGPSVAGVVLPQDPLYPLEILFGWHGLFTVSPVLLFGAAGLLLRVRSRPPQDSTDAGRRTFWVALGLGILAQIGGHALVAGSYGGWSYGFRYLVPVQPLLMLAAPAALAAGSGRSSRSSRSRSWTRALFAAVLPVSILFAALGAYHPWPPAFEQASHRAPVVSAVTNPVGANAAAWAEQHFPGSGWARALGRRFVARDPEQRRRYFEIFFGSKGDLVTMRRFAR